VTREIQQRDIRARRQQVVDVLQQQVAIDRLLAADARDTLEIQRFVVVP
jgi:hypothetical protein